MAKALCDHCCCCIELRMGSLIIGYMELISFIYFIIEIIKAGKAVETIIDYIKKLPTLKNTEEEFEEIFQVIRAVTIGLIIVWGLLIVLKIFFNIILLIGLHKNKRGHVGAYLIYSAIFLFIGIVFLIAFIIKYSKMNMPIQLPEQDMHMIVGQFISFLISLVLSYVISVYFWMVIRSQYQSMPINRPKKFRNPMDAGPLPANVRPEGPTSQISDESRRGTNMANNSGQCKPPMETGSLKSRASTDVRSEGQVVQLNQESNRATYVADNYKQHGSLDVSPTSSESAVHPEEPSTPQNIKEGSQCITENSRLFSSPVDVTFNIGSDS